MQALLHYSLAGGFASPRIVRTLEAVSYLVPHSRSRGNDANSTSLTEAISLISRASADRTLSRLLETFQFVLDVMGCSAPAESAHNDPFTENDNFQQDHVAHQGGIAHIVPGGDGWRSAVRVRLLHGVARWRVQERWKKEGRFDNAVPISQEDLAATLAAFSTIPIWCLNKLGIQPSDSEASAYLALWRHVGFYLGIEPKILLRLFTSTRTADKFLATAALHLFSDDATHAPENPADAQTTILRGPTIPILVAVSNRPPLHTSLEYNIALTRYLLGPSLSAHLELPDTSLRVRLRMHAFLFVQRIPYYFARCYPRKRWLEKRRTVLREGMVRTLWWNLGLSKTTFRPRTMVRDGHAAPEESSAKDGELAPGVAEQEAVRPDPVRAKVLTKLWSEVWQEMVAVDYPRPPHADHFEFRRKQLLSTYTYRKLKRLRTILLRLTLLQMTEIMPEQGRAGLSLPSPINMDWQYPDRDVDAPVYLLVYAPTDPSHTWRDLHWSVAWPTSSPSTLDTPADIVAWRHIQVETYDVKTDPAPQPRYVFWGACTKSADENATAAEKLQLGTFPKAQRKQIEELAWETAKNRDRYIDMQIPAIASVLKASLPAGAS
ncbi:hypothetical protein BN946_scf184845.g16 [Trametes cinnabarina]|uniref:ER-bound oxygenase mpaB/mpaB'/Rubber oxygenase catalytic domain-containing protein n=1 Tax=Pycnoporus cinnabarinus TaxID=5643 RepID=A0A060SA76_PYCCI|nr:hypothetical protein BN946_scf184845.g16 [Trametes cinnabarina]